MVANRMRYGTSDANSGAGVNRSKRAPTTPPAIEGSPNSHIQRRLSPSSRRKPNIALSDPGQSATVLVTLAPMGSIPIQTNVGNVASMPPPATELTMPAKSAAAKASSADQSVTVAG